MINRLAAYAIAALLFAGSVGSQEPFQVSTTIQVASFQVDKGVRYLLVYKEWDTITWCTTYPCKVPAEDKLSEHEVYKYFPTIESALAWMNQGTDPRVSKKMFVSLSYVVPLDVIQESEMIHVNREVNKWRVRP